ncbi:MAG: hypothetical protein DME17_19505 [Candidatus Rokuibacteriota bacterium]|nr:MAG: hypothetical protein DME17_19505 [Candidatus Rokubacteria bacterium]
MNTMLRWSPTRQFHRHHDDNLFARFFGDATDEAAQRPPWLPAAEGRTEDGTYVIQLALPGVDPPLTTFVYPDFTQEAVQPPASSTRCCRGSRGPVGAESSVPSSLPAGVG